MLTPSLLHLDTGRLLPHQPERSGELQASIDRLFDRINYERVSPNKYDLADFELSRMRRLLEELDNPQLATPCVHIAGTKGKGSTASMTASVLTAAGYTTGLFMSPHIHHFEERITVDRAWAAPAAYEASFEDVWAAVERLDSQGYHATYFEISTALAWDVFRRLNCDIAVVEVGLGGRLDSTNICSPLVTAITSISRDHSKLLGDTLAEIAAEKAGIFKAGVPSISGVNRNTADVVAEAARNAGSELWQLGREIAFDVPDAEPLTSHDISVKTPTQSHEKIPVALPGPHQSRNAALVVAICDLLANQFEISEESLRRGLVEAVCPLRIEVVSTGPTIVLDAAHNGASTAALVETLRPVRAKKRWLIFGTSQDKHVDDMLEQFAAANADEPSFADEVVIAEYSTNPRALPAEELATLARSALGDVVRVADSAVHAIESVLAEADANDLIVVTGSFFLAGEVRQYLIHAATNSQERTSLNAEGVQS